MKVIGTAGHIDHGKSTLVHRLTGIDPDRLSEEKRRGMTIDLGFAWITLPSGAQASIVDVPGHERFVKNMLAGAAGVDVALLVVAADEGVMPQTREHLDILDLLGVAYGVVALTKSDLVDRDWLELVREDVASTLAGTSLADSRIVPVSSTTGAGIPTLLDALDRALTAGPPPRDRGRPFVPIDRVFTISGFGTVVTGTLHDGGIDEGADLEIMPRGGRTRVRSLQTHEEQVDHADAGARVALNLSAVSTGDVSRGGVVAPKGAVLATTRIDAWIRVLPSSSLPLRHGMRVSAHIGSAEIGAAVSVLGGDEIAPNASGWVQLRLGKPLAATRDQRLILRLPSPARTFAGGVVVDVAPRHRRFDPQSLVTLAGLMATDPRERLLAALSGKHARSLATLAFRSGLSDAETGEHIATLTAAGTVIALGERYMTADRWTEIARQVRTSLVAYHAANPLRRGMSKEELRDKVEWHGAGWTDVLSILVRSGVVRVDGPTVALVSHGGGISSRRADADAVLRALTEEPYAPPNKSTLLQTTGADDSLLGAMVTEGEIVRVDAGLYFERAAYDGVVRHIVSIIEREGEITVGTVRDRLGTTRKYALALLEHLDDEHITRRTGDSRILGSKSPSRA